MHLPKDFFKSPRVMGILNVTPDSFSDAGHFFSLEKAVKWAKEMMSEGVDIIDIGGESTGPGSSFVSLEEELRRVIPVIKKLSAFAHKKGVLISIDTYKSEVARQAIEAGVDIINDVTALRGDEKMAYIAAKSHTPIILMYAKDATPRTTRKKIRYQDVIKTVTIFFKKRIQYAKKHGIATRNIILDPGMGAFISALPEYSFEILNRLPELQEIGFPLLVGVSRKSFFGGNIGDRFMPGLIASMMALQSGANIIRVHDTKEACRLKKMAFPTARRTRSLSL